MHKFFALLLISVICANGQEENYNNIVNKNVERTIDLTSQLVKISVTITLENTGEKDIASFLVVLEPGIESNLSYISFRDDMKHVLKYEKLASSELADHKHVFYRVNVYPSLHPGFTTNVHVEYVLTKALVPYPSSITQKEKQLVRYFGSHYFYSPYATIKQTSTLTLASKNIESYTKLKPVSQSEATITYGPYNNIPGFSFDRMLVHYENHSPFLSVTRLQRLIEISHWGNIAVEENIEILHTGAKLKGPFSRYDYQRDTSQNHHSIKSYRTILPSAAHNVYYRDSNGNISTSTVRPRKEWIELELRPRFPLFGGWRSSYTLGYNVPSYQYLYKRSDGTYLLKMRLIDHVFDDMHVEELETSIVLPVGVQNVTLSMPYHVDRWPDTVTHKYLDRIGRKVVKVTKNNLVEHHIQDMEVLYMWEPYMLLHEPICIISALMSLFMIVIIYVRLDFSIHY